jgi:hypothetical protein
MQHLERTSPWHVSRRDFCRSALAASSLVAAGLPLRALAMGGRTRTDVRVSDDGYASHAEPCLAVNPRDPRNLLAASQAWPASGDRVPTTYASFDGGLTWRSNGPLPVPAGIRQGGDVTAGFDGTGRGFVCGGLEYGGGSSVRTVHVWRTEDGGRTFTPPVAVTEGVQDDHPWLAVERRWPRAVHVVWSAEGFSALGYARSTDEGRTFEAPRTIASVGANLALAVPMVACGPPGGVYAIYTVGQSTAGGGKGGPPPETTATVTVVCSQDWGQTFDPPIELGQGTIFMPFPGGATSSSLPAIAADPDGGLVCAAFTVHEAGAGHADILLAASRDGGRTWSPASAVTPQDQVIYFQPQVAIDDAGRIGVMAFAMAQGMVSVVLMVSQPGSLRFGPPITVTDQPFDPAKGPAGGARWWIGDYQALATTPGAFHPLWNDTRTGQLELFTAAVLGSA